MDSFKSLDISYIWKGCTDGEEAQGRLLENWLYFLIWVLFHGHIRSVIIL